MNLNCTTISSTWVLGSGSSFSFKSRSHAPAFGSVKTATETSRPVSMGGIISVYSYHGHPVVHNHGLVGVYRGPQCHIKISKSAEILILELSDPSGWFIYFSSEQQAIQYLLAIMREVPPDTDYLDLGKKNFWQAIQQGETDLKHIWGALTWEMSLGNQWPI